MPVRNPFSKRWPNQPPLGYSRDPSHNLGIGLVAYWPISEIDGSIIYDQSGNYNHITINDGIRSNLILSPSQFFKGYQTSGESDDYAFANMSPSSYPVGNSARTINFWCFSSLATEHSLLDYAYSATAGASFTVYIKSDRRLVADIGTSGLQTYTNVPPIDRPFMVTIIVPYGASILTDIDIYINALQRPTSNIGFGGRAINTTTPSIRFGTSQNGRTSNNDLSEVRIYNRVLRPSEITELYVNPWADYYPPRSYQHYVILLQKILPSSVDSAEVVGEPNISLDEGLLLSNVGNISSAENIPSTHQFNLILPSTGNIPSSEEWGSPLIVTHINPIAISSEETIPEPTVNLTIFAGDIESQESFGDIVIESSVNIFPNGIISEEFVSSPIMEIRILGEGIASDVSFGLPRITLYIFITSIFSTEEVSEPSISTTSYIVPSGIESTENVGDHKLVNDIESTSITSEEEFGLIQLNLTIFISSIDSTENIGTPTLESVISPLSILSEELFSLHDVIRGGVVIAVSSIESEENFGSPLINLTIFPISIETENNFGPSRVCLDISPISIESENEFGIGLIISDNNLLVTTIDSNETFEEPQLNLTIFPSMIYSSEVVGSPTILVNIEPVSIASLEATGSLALHLTLFVSGITSTEIIGNHLLIAADQFISVSSINSAETVAPPQVNLTIFMTDIVSQENVGTINISSNIEDSGGVHSGEAFGVAIIELYIIPESCLFESNIGTPQLLVTIPLDSIITSETFGDHAVNMTIHPMGVVSTERVETPTLSQRILCLGIDSVELVNFPQLNLRIQIESIESLSTVGNPTLVIATQFIKPTSILSSENIGFITINCNIFPYSIISQEMVGIHHFTLSILPINIPSSEEFGSGSLLKDIQSGSIESSEMFGIPSVHFTIHVNSIDSQENVNDFTRIVQNIHPTSILSTETFELPQIIVGDIIISVISIESKENFSNPLITIYIRPSSILSTEIVNNIEVFTTYVIRPSAIVSEEVFGSVKVNLTIFLHSISSQESFTLPSVNLFINPYSILSDEDFGDYLVSSDIQNGSIESEEYVSSPRLRVRIHLNPGLGIASSEAIPSPFLHLVVLVHSWVESVFGTATVKGGEVFISCPSIGSGESHGITNIIRVISPTSIPTQESFGYFKSNTSIIVEGLESIENVSTPHLVRYIYPTEILGGIVSNPTLSLTIFLTGIISIEAFGLANITQTEPKIVPDSIPELMTIGHLQINLRLFPQGIESGEDFTREDVYSPSIPTGENFGNLKLNLSVDINSIVTGEIFGIALVYEQLITLDDAGDGIVSGETFGNPWVVNHGVRARFTFRVTGRTYAINPTARNYKYAIIRNKK